MTPRMSKLFVAAAAIGGILIAEAGIHDEPDGVSMLAADDGEFKIISVGSGVYDFNDADDVLDARKEAERNAKVAIAKFFKESFATEEAASQQMSKMKKMNSDGESESVSVSKTTAKQVMERVRSSSSALLSGIVVMEDEKVPNENKKGGVYRVMVGVSSKTVKGAANAGSAMSSGQGAVGSGSGSSSAGAVPAGVVEAQDDGKSSGVPSASLSDGLPLVPEGWTVCVGIGGERKEAVQAALVEGISQVYGEVLQHDERQSERMKKFKMNASVMGNDIDAVIKSKTKESQSSTLSKTAGFVREYRIAQVVPKDGKQEATVYAYIVNPRAGGTVALLVKRPTMTVEDRAAVYQLGPKTRMSGAEVAKAVQFALPNGLAKANKFLILNEKSIDAVIENKTVTTAMVAAGLANASELMPAGQGLTPDMSLTSELSDINYSKKLGQDKKTKKFGTMYKMTAKLNVTLTNDRSGQIVKSEVITLSLDNDEIKGLLEEDEDVDLLQALLSKLADPIDEWMKAN